ncbi:hypothetical protein Goshw_017497 [Gossypium schwendimanii]|uniref:Uncharacterized protein n=1 Tax=Gossypium schwendimanii TaxID=34291 RepID=A0A7J9KYP9_GOSSC|nr:hypothetical protein [Gossypium schwendimanii]
MTRTPCRTGELKAQKDESDLGKDEEVTPTNKNGKEILKADSIKSSGETKKLKELEESGTTIFIDALGRLVRDIGDKVISIHFNPAFEDLSIVPMAVNERGSGGNFVGSKGGWKINKTLKGSSNQFKAMGSSRVSFLRTMLKVADLINSELEGHAVQEKYNPGIISFLEMRVSGFKVDAIISKLGSKRSHQVEAVGFSGGIWLGLKEFVDVEIEKEASLKGFEVVYSPRALSLDGNGDFNAILSVEEKKYGDASGHRCHFFGEFVDMAQLHDLGFRGASFTWHRVLLFERLGRAFW